MYSLDRWTRSRWRLFHWISPDVLHGEGEVVVGAGSGLVRTEDLAFLGLMPDIPRKCLHSVPQPIEVPSSNQPAASILHVMQHARRDVRKGWSGGERRGGKISSERAPKVRHKAYAGASSHWKNARSVDRPKYPVMLVTSSTSSMEFYLSETPVAVLARNWENVLIQYAKYGLTEWGLSEFPSPEKWRV